MLWWMADAISNRFDEFGPFDRINDVSFIHLISHSYRTGYDISFTTPLNFITWQYLTTVEYLTPIVRYINLHFAVIQDNITEIIAGW